MKPSNPRSGHFTLGPNSNDPWWRKLLIYVTLGIFFGILHIAEWLGKTVAFLGELF